MIDIEEINEDALGSGNTFLINNSNCNFAGIIEEIRKIRVE